MWGAMLGGRRDPDRQPEGVELAGELGRCEQRRRRTDARAHGPTLKAPPGPSVAVPCSRRQAGQELGGGDLEADLGPLERVLRLDIVGVGAECLLGPRPWRTRPGRCRSPRAARRRRTGSSPGSLRPRRWARPRRSPGARRTTCFAAVLEQEPHRVVASTPMNGTWPGRNAMSPVVVRQITIFASPE